MSWRINKKTEIGDNCRNIQNSLSHRVEKKKIGSVFSTNRKVYKSKTQIDFLKGKIRTMPRCKIFPWIFRTRMIQRRGFNRSLLWFSSPSPPPNCTKIPRFGYLVRWNQPPTELHSVHILATFTWAVRRADRVNTCIAHVFIYDGE